MKTAWYGLVLALAVSTGCVGLPKPDDSKPLPPQPATIAKKPVRASTLVRPDQVNAENAHEAAVALQNEMNHDTAGEDPPGPTLVPEKP
jgi:hypothetical protein